MAVWPQNESNWPKDLFEQIFDASLPIPDPKEYPDAIWPYIVKFLSKRVVSLIKGILGHATKRQADWLRLGGPGGAVAAIRALKFCFRIKRAESCDGSLVAEMIHISDLLSDVLSQEAWRRWALASFVQSHNSKVNDLFLSWQVFMEVVLNSEVNREVVCLHFYTVTGG